MPALIDFPKSAPIADQAVIKVAIVYEDFVSGTRGRRFAEHLAEGLGCICPLFESIWRCELLECPAIAAQAARATADCAYLIVSLRGDRVLSPATRRWIEAQLPSAARRDMWLIALLGSNGGKPRIQAGNRSYLRTVCAATDVVFFSLVETPPAGCGEPAFHSREDHPQWPPLLPA